MNAQVEGGKLVIFLDERIDTNNSAEVESSMKSFVAGHPDLTLEFDAEKLQYISSVGLRILLKLRKAAAHNLVIRNVSRDVAEIFEVTGFTNFFDLHRKLRSISIENCPQVGAGLSSKVYRIDPENIVKVYNLNVPLYKIEREMDLAKKAFLAGLPTAISYDLVRVGGAYGVVFEMIGDSVTVGKALQEDNCKNFSAIMKKFAHLMKAMHHTKVSESDGFPSIKSTWLDWAEGMRKFYTDKETAMLQKMVHSVPDRETIVHCDFHAGNTLYQNGEVVVIDMADVSYGHPVFDFAAGAFHALLHEQDYIQMSLNLSGENILRFWNELLRSYFGTDDDKAISEIKDTFTVFALLRSALFPMKHVQMSEERKLLFVASARERFFPNFDLLMKRAGNIGKIFD